MLTFNVKTGGGVGSGDCTATGNYYYQVLYDNFPQFTGYVYYEIYYDAGTGVVTPVNPTTPETGNRIVEITNPTFGTTTASTTLHARFTYLLNGSDFNGYRIIIRHQLSGYVGTYYGIFTSTSTSLASEARTIPLLYTGGYSLQVNLCNIQDIGTPSCMSVNGASTLFYAVQNDGGIQTVVSQGLGQIISYDKSSCAFNLNPFASSTFALDECMGYLFKPSTTSIASLNPSIGLEQRAPFVYFYQAPALVSKLFTTPTNGQDGMTVNLGVWGDFTFINQAMIAGIPFVPLLKIVLMSALFILSLVTLYRKIVNMHSEQTS